MEIPITAKHSPLFPGPYIEAKIELPHEFMTYLLNEDYKNLDLEYQASLKPEGFLWRFLSNYCNFNKLEGILAIREAPNDDEGIWHDDGSRVMGFSLSLNINPETIKGGELLLRQRFIFKDSEDTGAIKFGPRPYGTIIMFKTGQDSFEHRVTKVTMGKRVILAGWCS